MPKNLTFDIVQIHQVEDPMWSELEAVVIYGTYDTRL